MPRRLAYDVLCQVLGKSRPLDDAFNTHPHLEKLTPKGKNFARNLATTTLRHKGFIDYLIDGCLEKRPKGTARNVLNIMRLAVAQLYFMNVPAHAILSEAQILTGRAKFMQYKKLVNGVLRRLEREKKDYPPELIARKNIPDWLFNRWEETYGAETALKIAMAHLKEAALDITPRYEDEAAIWVKRLEGTALPTGSVRLPVGGRIEELNGYDKGAWWVQDTAASLPVKLLGDLKGKRVFDLCAAPGGKTMQLAAAGAHVLAVDKSERRLKRVHENLERTGLKAEVLAADLMEWTPEEQADVILLDAPCSATGTLRRHPDGLWTKKPEDIKSLADIQGKVWHRASDWVKPGGVILYCTCSLQPEEGEAMTQAFLKGHKNFEQVAFSKPEYSELFSEDGALRCLPSHFAEQGGLDGFYAVLVRRTS